MVKHPEEKFLVLEEGKGYTSITPATGEQAYASSIERFPSSKLSLG